MSHTDTPQQPDPSDPRAIQFSVLRINGTPVELMRCDRCQSLLLPDDTRSHADWHGLLRRETVYASLGFGGTGL